MLACDITKKLKRIKHNYKIFENSVFIFYFKFNDILNVEISF